MLGTILIVISILMLLGAMPTWGQSRNWGYGPAGWDLSTAVSYNASTFHDRNRTLQGVFAAARDVTERTRHEQSFQPAFRGSPVKHDFKDLTDADPKIGSLVEDQQY